MIPELEIASFVGGLFAGVLACMELGRRIGIRRASKRPESSNLGLGSVEGSVFALLGLLMAFSFSGAASRFDLRRQLIVNEANAIGTAYLRLDLLPAAERDKLREEFRRYVDARLDVYRLPAGEVEAQAASDRSVAIQGEIWRDAVAACRMDGTPQTATLVVPALNEMIDLVTSRAAARSVHQPILIYAVIALLAFACGLLAGHDMSSFPRRPWFHMISFSAMVALTMYVILDLE